MPAFGMHRAHPEPTREASPRERAPESSPRTRRFLGAAAVLTFLGLLAWPVARSFLPPPYGVRGLTAKTQNLEPAQMERKAASAVEQVRRASDALEQAAAKAIAAQASTPPAAPPLSSTTAGQSARRAATANETGVPPALPWLTIPRDGSPTACVESFLPDGAFGEGADLGFICEEQELWVINRHLHDRIALRGSGKGAELWVRLGRFELAAVSIVRAVCCPGAAVFTAVLPTARCGSLAAVLDAVSQSPTAENVDRYAETIDCLIERKVRVPDPWRRSKRKTQRKHFDEFLATGGR